MSILHKRNHWDIYVWNEKQQVLTQVTLHDQTSVLIEAPCVIYTIVEIIRSWLFTTNWNLEWYILVGYYNFATTLLSFSFSHQIVTFLLVCMRGYSRISTLIIIM